MAAVTIDSALAQLAAQLGSGPPPSWPSPSFGSPVAPVPTWHGDASDAAHRHSARLEEHRSALAAAHRKLAPLVATAAQVTVGARADLANVVARWQADKAALAPVAATAVGKAAVLRAGVIRLAEARAVVTGARERFGTLATQVRSVTGELPDPGVVQTVDFQQGPLPAGPPQPPRPPYPQNDIIAEATDLDGNHVVLRRGYYDAVTQQGFGWDKSYWRHGVVNVNVFKDLISHSRPKERNEDGTVIYEVQVNETHCGKNFIGLLDCSDTGQSVVMRIVVNTLTPHRGVPDGGQKGVISIYPKEGKDVLLLGPRWTWTPPWVNTNAPIN